MIAWDGPEVLLSPILLSGLPGTGFKGLTKLGANLNLLEHRILETCGLSPRVFFDATENRFAYVQSVGPRIPLHPSDQ